EQGNLYNAVSTNVTNYKSWVRGFGGANDQGWRAIRGNTIPVYVCPSEGNGDSPGSRAGDGWARGNYAANSGPGYYGNNVGGASANDNFGVQGGGPMCVNWGIKLESLTNQDGSSNTILINHVRAGPSPTDMRGTWAFGMPGASITASNAYGDCY